METLALMLVVVAISVVIGVPLGVAAGLNRRFYAFLRPVLDAMQTVPSTAYLVPAVLFFGIGPVPAAVATVIYALAPVVRLTALGIRQVPVETVEAGHVFGSTRRQLLFKVQLPQAKPSIMTGVNQTINMALGIIVIAALVGAGGLGQEALETLRLRSPGRGLVVGLAIVAVAIMLDRVSRSFIDRRQPSGWSTGGNARWLVVGAIVLVAVVVGRQAGWTAFPADWGVTWADWVNDAVAWVRDNWRGADEVAQRVPRPRRPRAHHVVVGAVGRLAGARRRCGPRRLRDPRLASRPVLRTRRHRDRPRRTVGPGAGDARAGVPRRRAGDDHRRPGRHPRRPAAAVRAGHQPGARRLPDDPAARLHDPVRHHLRRRHRARGHHRLGHLRDPAGDPCHRPRRAVGAGRPRSRRRRRSARHDGSCCGACACRSPCRR